MSLHVERIDWMPSPPLAPDDGPIDTAHLDRMTLGDSGLEREVLAMFSAQALGLVGKLAALAAEAGYSKIMELAHQLKGSARAIGAFAVAEAAEDLETAARNGDDPVRALARVKDTVTEARAAIDALLRRS
jgi:HPt (histidine-containing phosphotransfer) domain-containing protein